MCISKTKQSTTADFVFGFSSQKRFVFNPLELKRLWIFQTQRGHREDW